MRRPRTAGRFTPLARLLLAAAALLPACAGEPGGGAGPNPGVPDQPFGEPRLVWTQRASSLQLLDTYAYVLFVDGIARDLEDVRCDRSPTSAGYPCSSRPPNLSPGRYVLELAAVANGVESERSPALTYTAGAAATFLLPPTTPVTPTETSDVSCVLRSATGCLAATAAAAVRGRVSSPAATPDGRLFYVHDKRQVRLVDERGLVPSPALEVTGAADEITGLSVHPGFASNRLVFVAWIERRPDGRASLNVSRYREVGGVLGEGAVLVAGLPAPADARTPIALDDRGRIYLAYGRAEEQPASSFEFTGQILRFASDGTVPQGQRMVSPVLARGPARPGAMAWDPRTRRLWISGTTDQSQDVLAVLSADDETRQTWPATPALIPTAWRSQHVDGSAPFLSLLTDDAARRVWIVLPSGDVQRAPVDAAGALGAFSSVDFRTLGHVSFVIGGKPGDIYVVARSIENAVDQDVVIWRLK